MARKPNYTGSKKLKLVKAPPPKKLTQFRLAIGTANEMGKPREISTEAKLRQEIGLLLNGHWTHWCKRYNLKGLEAIEAGLNELAQTTISVTHKQLKVKVDERYDVTVVFEFWKVWA